MEDGASRTDPVTGEYVAAVSRVRRLLRTTWDPEGTLVADPTLPGAYQEQARHVASLVWMGENADALADYLASGGVETAARPRLSRVELLALARAIASIAAAPRPSA